MRSMLGHRMVAGVDQDSSVSDTTESSSECHVPIKMRQFRNLQRLSDLDHLNPTNHSIKDVDRKNVDPPHPPSHPHPPHPLRPSPNPMVSSNLNPNSNSNPVYQSVPRTQYSNKRAIAAMTDSSSSSIAYSDFHSPRQSAPSKKHQNDEGEDQNDKMDQKNKHNDVDAKLKGNKKGRRGRRRRNKKKGKYQKPKQKKSPIKKKKVNHKDPPKLSNDPSSHSVSSHEGKDEESSDSNPVSVDDNASIASSTASTTSSSSSSSSSTASSSSESLLGDHRITKGGPSMQKKKKRGPPPKSTVPPNKRECPICTFHNAKRAKQCVMCSHKFPEQVFERVNHEEAVVGINGKKKKKNQQKKGNQSKGGQKQKNENNALNANGNGNAEQKKKRGRNARKKDWKCSKCGSKNKKATNVCQCGHIRPMTEHEWLCECTARNHVNLNKCTVCGTIRGWQCKNCMKVNPKRFGKCQQCHKPRPCVGAVAKKKKKKKKKKQNVQRIKLGVEPYDSLNQQQNHNLYSQQRGGMGARGGPRSLIRGGYVPRGRGRGAVSHSMSHVNGRGGAARSGSMRGGGAGASPLRSRGPGNMRWSQHVEKYKKPRSNRRVALDNQQRFKQDHLLSDHYIRQQSEYAQSHHAPSNYAPPVAQSEMQYHHQPLPAHYAPSHHPSSATHHPPQPQPHGAYTLPPSSPQRPLSSYHNRYAPSPHPAHGQPPPVLPSHPHPQPSPDRSSHYAPRHVAPRHAASRHVAPRHAAPSRVASEPSPSHHHTVPVSIHSAYPPAQHHAQHPHPAPESPSYAPSHAMSSISHLHRHHDHTPIPNPNPVPVPAVAPGHPAYAQSHAPGRAMPRATSPPSSHSNGSRPHYVPPDRSRNERSNSHHAVPQSVSHHPQSAPSVSYSVHHNVRHPQPLHQRHARSSPPPPSSTPPPVSEVPAIVQNFGLSRWQVGAVAYYQGVQHCIEYVDHHSNPMSCTIRNLETDVRQTVRADYLSTKRDPYMDGGRRGARRRELKVQAPPPTDDDAFYGPNSGMIYRENTESSTPPPGNVSLSQLY